MLPIRLTFDDYLLIAADTRRVSLTELEQAVDQDAVEAALSAPFADPDEIDLYPHTAEKAAICCSEMLQRKLLPEGNTEVAYRCMLDMFARAGHPWPLGEDWEEVPAMVNALAEDEITERDFVCWVRARIAQGEVAQYARRCDLRARRDLGIA